MKVEERKTKELVEEENVEREDVVVEGKKRE